MKITRKKLRQLILKEFLQIGSGDIQKPPPADRGDGGIPCEEWGSEKYMKSFNIVLDASTLGLILYFNRNILALFPPLIIDEEIADEIVEIIDKSLDTSLSANIARKARLAKEFAASQILKTKYVESVGNT